MAEYRADAHAGTLRDCLRSGYENTLLYQVAQGIDNQLSTALGPQQPAVRLFFHGGMNYRIRFVSDAALARFSHVLVIPC
jgi:hypothetical protein